MLSAKSQARGTRVSIGTQARTNFKVNKIYSIARRELDQFGFYGPGIVIIHSETLNDTSGFWSEEKSSRAISLTSYRPIQRSHQDRQRLISPTNGHRNSILRRHI
jgi:hypothetical protein